ncbi:hypothetical protein DF182_03755 [Chitinophaga flava]|uniref:Uncharacterized protein n=1 Tax=Chitinophaga flava TaxID=2259036 RepID=A0A365XZH4_9BACT|nr:hypothetical protein DF182_03755 [Chitinophaga flava]
MRYGVIKETFRLEAVQQIYNDHHDKAKDRELIVLDNGSHGFIYEPEKGKGIVEKTVLKLLK